MDRHSTSKRWGGRRFAIWGSELSPFALKLRALMAHADLNYAWLPAEGRLRDKLHGAGALRLGNCAGTIERFGGLHALDEYPLVPFLFEAGEL